MCIFNHNQNQTPRSDSANLEPSEPISCPQILIRPGWNECLANVTKKLACEPSCDEESVQMATLAAVKKLNSSVPGIFYLNTVLDFPFLRLHQTLLEAGE